MKLRRRWDRLGLFSKYIVVGSIVTIVDVALVNAFFSALSSVGVGLPWSGARVAAYAVALVVAFLLHDLATFRTARKRMAPIKFVTINLLVATLGSGVFYLFEVLGGVQTPLQANLLNLALIGVGVLVRFTLYRTFVWT